MSHCRAISLAENYYLVFMKMMKYVYNAQCWKCVNFLLKNVSVHQQKTFVTLVKGRYEETEG